MYGWNRQSIRPFILARQALTLLATVALSGHCAFAQEAQWIWTPEHQKEGVPSGAVCHFRKSFNVKDAEAATVAIAADDHYELYVNGRRAGSGSSTRKLIEYDIGRFLVRGNNIVAVKVSNRGGNTAALAARLTIKEKKGQWISHSTDDSWRTNVRPLPLWNTSLYNDRNWEGARSFGTLGETAPWDRAEAAVANSAPAEREPQPSYGDPAESQTQPPVVDAPRAESQPQATAKATPTAKDDGFKEPTRAGPPRSGRFNSGDEFEVQQVLSGQETGSLIAMTFNEFGQVIASKEDGPLLLFTDSNGDKLPDNVRTCCEKVSNCQGILALNGEVYVTGQGPDGPGLYRLTDTNRDGVLEEVRTLLKFKCEVNEHGPHGLVLGPDGLLYVLLGNHTQVEADYDPTSPHRDYYEGDLLAPKYEDPGGHAVGIKAPGGVVIRTDTDGSGVQLVCGGLRNPYDLVFNQDGELFVHDADMESDIGTTWYRPTRLCHLIPGGEYGWRSGWSKWPEYYVDSLPGILDTGRGSPTGIAAYNHFMFPLRYHGCLFTADWSQGKIMAVALKRQGASYAATSEVFVEGNPLNVTDLDVGPDGWLYFVTGGRGTSGGLYRVVWKGHVPPQIVDVGTGLTAVIRQPQLHSSWARQNIATLKRQLGPQWDASLIGVAKSTANPAQYRLQALDLMQLFGPTPSADLLIKLSQQPNELVRARAVELMGTYPSDASNQRLIELLADGDRRVRRLACESLARAGQAPPLESLKPLLASDDRYEAWAARRLLERMRLEDWKDELLSADNHRLIVQGGLALLIAYGERKHGMEVLERVDRVMDGFVGDRDFVDMLRLTEVALARGGLHPEDVPGIRRQLAEEFPAGDSQMNRELVRILVFLQESSALDRYLAYLKSDAPDADKLHVAMHLRFLESGWSSGQRMELLSFYEDAQKRKGGGSYARYVINATRDFCKSLSEDESMMVLAKGSQWPNSALGALYRVPEKLDADMLQTIIKLDQELADKDGDAAQRLKVGLVAVLARSGNEEAFAYLRKVWDSDPNRRQSVALGLAQAPQGENWVYLVRSLPSLEPSAARDVCTRLMEVAQAPEEAEPYRTLILLALKAKQKEQETGNGAALDAPVALLEFWTGEELAKDMPDAAKVVAWQEWFAKTYPDQPEPVLPTASENAKYSFDQLLTYLTSEEVEKASGSRGAAIFTKAQCTKCHKHGSHGESIGPDLTNVSRRFTKKELLESIVYPSHVISSQYLSKVVKTKDGRQITGMVAAGAAGEVVVLQPTGEKLALNESEIEATKPSKTSAMPAGLLDPLSLEEVADLMAFLEGKDEAELSRKPLIIEPR
ncbi:MAG TPA: HEAT repeat domain-containing protein [Pirellulaceae bacterium]|nr:HEAT repeat domain-containing protein [Pirellulaceae bacterium]